MKKGIANIPMPLKKQVMNKTTFFTGVLVTLITIGVHTFAQQQPTSDSIFNSNGKDKSYALVGMTYNSDIVFLGRRSPVKSPYVSASLSYYNKTGLYLTGTISWLASSKGKGIDLFTASGGYDYNKKKFVAGIFATGYVFNSKSQTAKSALTGKLNAYADYDFDILEIYGDGTLYLSNEMDYVFSLAVSHNFYARNGKLEISPSFSLYAGTQNYFSNYNNNMRFGQHMLNNINIPSMGTGMMGKGTFNMLDYEFGLPVQYLLKRFQFFFFPVYAIPVNAATITENQNTYKEDLSNTFYWSLGVSYKISKLKK
ncbi:hypothetical protein A3860_34315 [Niastella vici]|uniref:Uncharacterized protein n=1 Tax=Niastella vici TaxID=1703345 RepID=A0A1V9FPD2_9BACT|nr:hypothetical protein [Niastella vici]OQP60157.1 hypothetical protein A3860_34315 [Niastella vici]